MRGVGFIISLVVVVVCLFLASGAWTYYTGHEYWQTDKAGLATGFIHGAIAPIMIVIGIFSDYGIYETNNSGWFYDLFFIFGILIVWAGAGGSRHIIKNYYNAPGQKLPDSHKKEIEKLVEKHVSKKLKDDQKSKKPKVGIKEKLISKIFRKKEKPDFKEEEIKSPIKVKKGKKK